MLSSFAGAQTGKTDNQFAMTRETLSSEMKMKLYLKLLENFAGWIESSDTFKDDETIEKGGGAFLAKGAGVTWPRGNSNLCIIYATLLTALPDQSHFSRYRIPRAQMEDHLRRTLRALCLTNKNCARCINPARWGGPSWQAALEFKGAAWAAHLMEKQLDAETVALVKEITCKEADNLDKPIATAAPGNTGSEDCSWNTPLLALAANKYPDHPHAARWQELARRWAVNAVSIASDKSNTQTLDGKPVKEWMASENLFADLTLENHGFWSTPYQSAFSLLLDGALAYRIFDRPVPETLSYRAREMWRTVTGPISVWDGDMLFPHGQDWAWKSYAHLEYFCWLNTLLKIPEAGAFESRAIQMTLRRQQAIGTGDL
ncbi:MAG: hypothetical protein NTX50_08275, partial [Candidatus Sumerlaeota bacterium]|nr:hypothetical protein [Candidatus Sumerlaeota bacterium]